MPRAPRPYQLTSAIVASSVGAGVLCLATEGLGRTFRLHPRRPGPERNLRAVRAEGGVRWRADLPSGAAHVIAPVAPAAPALIRVDISGPIEQRAGYHDPCGGWTDGNDAIAERLVAAFAEGDVYTVGDTPGGAAAGAQQGIAKALAAKAKHSRRCTGWANEQIGSLGMWWMLALCDELFIPIAGQLGSIGARGGHLSVHGALEKAGEVVTYFTWPDEGKIALAPELPLSDLGRARGERDVAIAGEAFCAAVIGSAIGQRYGLDRDRVIALRADMLTGQAAVDAGLCDGVASEEEVVSYALRMAERGDAKKSSSAQARARGGTMRTKTGSARAEGDEDKRARRAEDPDEAARLEGDEEPGARAEGDEDAPGKEPSGKCSSCGMQNEDDAKYCDQCGTSMAATPTPVESEGDEPEAEGDDEPPPSSKPLNRAGGPGRMSTSASFAEILGLPESASLPAQKTAAIDMRQVFDLAAQLTGQRTAARILGGLTALATDAAESGRLRVERDAVKKREAKAERWALAKRLIACGVPGYERGRVFADNVDAAGKRTGVKLTAVYAEMRLGVLRGLVEGLEKNAQPRDPFVPDPERAEAASRGARHGDMKARIERAKREPAVLRIFNAPGNQHTLDAIAEQFVKTIDAQQNGGAR